jgi:hypothetical protein
MSAGLVLRGYSKKSGFTALVKPPLLASSASRQPIMDRCR